MDQKCYGLRIKNDPYYGSKNYVDCGSDNNSDYGLKNNSNHI